MSPQVRYEVPSRLVTDDEGVYGFPERVGNMMNIRKATSDDLAAVESIYDEIHDAEEKGIITTGWLKGIYKLSFLLNCHVIGK